MANPTIRDNDLTAMALKDAERRINDVIFNIRNGNKERFNSIPLAYFKNFFWPWYSGKVGETVTIDGKQYNYRNIWIDKVAGSPFLDVNIVDGDGNVVATVPSLADTGILTGENLRNAGKTNVEAGAVAAIVNNNSHITNKGIAMYKALNDRYDKVIKSSSKEYIEKMELLFNFFGESLFNKTADEINAVNLNNQNTEAVKAEQPKTTKVDDGMGW